MILDPYSSMSSFPSADILWSRLDVLINSPMQCLGGQLKYGLAKIQPITYYVPVGSTYQFFSIMGSR